MKKLRRLVLLAASGLVFLFSLTGPFPAAARESTNFIDTYGNGEYAITKFDITVRVNENNSFFINEEICAYFNKSKHGIVRAIPLRNKVIRLDGSRSFNRARLSKVNVDNKFSLSTQGGYREIKIGDPNHTVIGPRKYSIEYLYNLGKDKAEGYDEFYFNLVGPEWDTTISNVSFTITMPKEFDESKLGFAAGPLDSTDSSRVRYEVQGQTITGRYLGVLQAGEALTVRLELPEGYFVGADQNLTDFITKNSLLAYLIPGLSSLIIFFLWARYGKDDFVVETVEFYPPAGYNSAEIGLLAKGKAHSRDLVSLLIYLANEGYLKIEEFGKKTPLVGNKDFKIIQIKEYEGKDTNEKLFLKGLFAGKKTNLVKAKTQDGAGVKSVTASDLADSDLAKSGLKSVTGADLQYSFYKTTNAILANLNSKENRRAIFNKGTFLNRALPVLLILFSYAYIVLRATISFDFWLPVFPFLLVFPSLGITAVLFAWMQGSTRHERIIVLIWGLLFAGIPLAGLVACAWLSGKDTFISFLVGIVLVLIMVIFFRLMPKRTAFGNEMLGKIKGFKTFLKTVEKPRLEALVLEDPSYFYNILPYAYVLDVSDKWIKKFASITIQPPHWYASSSSFSTLTFNRFINSTMATASRTMVSVPSSSGGGSGLSGGGSSGRGSGGGGGRSW